MIRKRYIIIISSILFGFFLLLSYLVAREYLVQFDFDLMVRIQDIIPDGFIGPFSILSDLGQFEVTFLIFTIIVIVFRKLWLFVAYFMFGLFHLIELYFKSAIDQLPPPEFFIKTIRVIDFPRYHIREAYSYPSGHSGRTMFLSIVIVWLILNSRRLSRFQKYTLVGFIFVFNVFMYVSRVYLGEHWLTDVVGGIILASALAIFSLVFYKRPVGRPRVN